MQWPGASSEVTEGQLRLSEVNEGQWRSVRSVSPPVLPPPPPDLPHVECHHNTNNEKPCFSDKTRDLFRQKLIRKRKWRPPAERPNQLDLSKSFNRRDFKKSINNLGKSYTRHLSFSPTTDIADGSISSILEFSDEHSSHHRSDIAKSHVSPWQNEELEIGGDCEAIPLPQTETIPQQNWTIACGWIYIVGRDIVACLFSRDWELRESSIRRLSREVANALTTNATESSLQEAMLADKLDRIWRCTAEMIAKAVEDKVFKVYWAALKATRTLLAFAHFTRDANYIKAGIKPIIQSILLKCSDGQNRMRELSLQTIAEICSNSQTFSIGTCGQHQRSPSVQLDGLDFIFQIILEDKDTSWQYTLGRLMALDHLLNTGCHVGFQHLQMALEFTFQNLSNGHSRVAKMAFKLFVAASKLMTVMEPLAFDHIWNLTLSLNPTLQLLLRKKLKAAILTLPPILYESIRSILEGHSDCLSPINHQNSVANSSTIQPLIRSTSNSPSRSPATNTLSLQKPRKSKRSTPYTKRPLKSNDSKKLKKPPDLPQFNQAWTNGLHLDISNEPLENVARHYQHNTNGHDQQVFPYVPALFTHRTWQNRLQTSASDDHKYSMYKSAQYGYKENQNWTKSFMLGSGAFSTCFQARDVQTGTLMAVKQITLNRGQDEDEKTKLECLVREEVNLMSQLDHPHLLRLYGVVEEDSQLNIFVEWMAGGSISRLLEKHGAFNERVIIKYSQQILLGLEYLHAFGILHRDLKGANLFVDTTGHHLRIGDFGAAAHLYSNMTYPGEFRGQVEGTFAFMAPEVLRGESYGRSCDIWSFGCCIIEMATGAAPWNASDISNHWCLMYKIACSQEPPKIPSHLSSGLQNLAFKCLQLNPDQRPHVKNLLSHPVFME